MSLPPALRRVVPGAVRRLAAQGAAGLGAARIERRLEALAAGGRPVIAGPWLGEVGFELLYWVPFLAWFAEAFGVGPERLVAVSRGGAGVWYAALAHRYVDALDHVAPEALKAEHERRIRSHGEQKQTRLTEFERRLLDAATRSLRITDAAVLHPSAMHELFNPYWWGHVGAAWVHARTRYRRLPGPPVAAGEPYVAAKFYFNDCFPPTDANRAFVAETLDRLAARGPVVSLHTRLALDDHAGAEPEAGARAGVHGLPDGLAPSRNLEAQDAVVAGARAVVGTYGGFSYLAPLHGVPSVGCFSEAAGYSRSHLAMARSAFAAIGVPDALHLRPVGDGAAAVAGQVAALAWNA